ncbi:hypothetical protein MKQ70_13735 [Chitinophaga sedimenti]|uniref:hypothetical protein n=1 Tax=Chitinophaga sedimenti TaxID=2033606 RepID=UPI0020063FFA|nr:hypothetical protein [Chitinophaga sedimenti]MCK7556024.1 hypothetical protein [Chitinophaga sedimenti]
MKGAAMAGGVIGACVLTALHELTRNVAHKAPRLDLLGMQALAKGLSKTPLKSVGDDNLHDVTLAGDIISNGMYFSLAAAGSKKNLFLRAGLLGAAAGVAAVCVPQHTALNSKHTSRTLTTKALTVGLYMAGSLAAAAAIRLLERVSDRK